MTGAARAGEWCSACRPRQSKKNLLKILRREIPLKRSNIPIRWVTARADQGPLRAVAFPIGRQSEVYLAGLTQETVVEALASAAGEMGSMAEYLHSTVSHLEDRGIHDRYLWRLQELVAQRIEDASGAGGA